MDYYSENRGPSFHPGGIELTKKAVRFCGFGKDAKLCDMGCGNGETKDYIEKEFGCIVTGIEPSENMGVGRKDIICAKADNTGLEKCSFDGVLFECVLSLCDDMIKTLEEAGRILKGGGSLIISDVYSKSGEICADGPLKWVYPEEKFRDAVENAGFEIVLYEDHTHEMLTMAAQMIMDGRAEEMCSLFSSLKKIKCGYFLLIAKKVA